MGKKSTADLPDAIALPENYTSVVSRLTTLIRDCRQASAARVNRELLMLYWTVGSVILRQQETENWGNSVVQSLAADLRIAFPDVTGFSRANVFQMRQFVSSCRQIDYWLFNNPESQDVSNKQVTSENHNVQTASGLLPAASPTGKEIVQTLSGLFELVDVSVELQPLIFRVSWSHHSTILTRCETAPERYFYMKLAASERWSVRELRRQIDSELFVRYTTVKRDPQKCLPATPEAGDLLPFRDHYMLEFLGLNEEHSEKELRRSILANLRDFFLEFGRDLAFVGEEYPLTIGNDTFSIDLVFYHRRLQCLIAVDLKKGKFKPEYVGKCCFYCAGLDQQIKLEHENPSIGLVLCRSADNAQVQLALTAAADRIGVATYQTGLPAAELIQRRLEQFRLDQFPDDDDESRAESPTDT